MAASSGWLANATLVLASTLGSLAAVEVGLRVTDAAPPSIYEADTTLIYRLAPGGRKTFVHNAANGGAKVRVQINADGFRGPRLLPAGSSRRIVVYGDSFIEGEFAEDSLTLPRMLERVLANRAPTEVVNAGVVADDGQVAGAALAQGRDERLGNAAQSKPAHHDRGAVGDRRDRLGSARQHFVHRMSSAHDQATDRLAVKMQAD